MPRAAPSSRRNSPGAGPRVTPAASDTSTTPPDQRFGRSRRLPDKAAFDRVFAKARRSRDRAFTVLCRRNDAGRARLGLAIARKHCRRAVARNRLKRIIRESFRRHQDALRGLDIVVMNRPGADLLGNPELFASLQGHWERCRAALPGNEGPTDG